MLTSAVLVVATMTAAVVTAGEEKGEAAGGEAAGRALQLAADPKGQLAFDKKSATVSAGKVAIDFVNKSPVPHNVTIAKGSKVIAQTKTLKGGTATASANLARGDYVFYCSVDGHRQAGMQGTLTVK